MTSKGETFGTVFAFAGLFIYGIEPVVIKTNPSNPLSFAAFSALVASLLLWPPLLKRRSRSQWTPRDVGKAFLVGLSGTALAYLAYSYGARMSTAINAALLTRAEVVYSFVLSYLFLRERITTRSVGYALLTLLGLLLVLTGGRMITPEKGDVLLLLVPLFWQIGHVIAKTLPYDAVTIAALRNTFGALLLLLLALWNGLDFHPLAVVEGAIIALGQVLWYASIKRINLSKATVIITPAPAVAIALSLALGETLMLTHVVGFLMITVGTLGMAKTKSEKRA
ncbi:DMT family transporter [Palaeococcus ferrophilus]|uniref:DMT family transporter n=1 Tax=Palaeococcus ferrophilus TaxID=83868 RepID=UPI00064FEF45|nr:DMT family transporter [Palaeococcus ferrophilus]